MKRLLTIKEFCAAYGTGRTRAYSMISAGLIEAVKHGPNTLICARSAEQWAVSLPRFKSAAASARATEAA